MTANPITNHKRTFFLTSTHVQGTVRELIEAGLTLNGHAVDKTILSTLAALGFAVEIGTAEKLPSASGIAPKIYRVDFTQDANFSIAPIELEIEGLKKQ